MYTADSATMTRNPLVLGDRAATASKSLVKPIAIDRDFVLRETVLLLLFYSLF
jgi:hypothetical protein